MKIFDYAGLKKSEHLDNRIFCGTGCCLGKIGKTFVHDGVALWQDGRDPLFWADEWKTDYVIMCTGKWGPQYCPDAGRKWEWIIIPSKKLAAKGIRRNLAKFGTKNWMKK